MGLFGCKRKHCVGGCACNDCNKDLHFHMALCWDCFKGRVKLLTDMMGGPDE